MKHQSLSMCRADLKEEGFFTSIRTFKGLQTSYFYLKSLLLNAIFFGCHSGGNLLNMKQQSLSMLRADLKEESFFTSTQTFKGLLTSYIYLKSFLLNDIFFGCHSGGNYLNMKHPSLSKYRVDLKGEGFFNSIQTFRGLQTSIIYLKSFLLNAIFFGCHLGGNFLNMKQQSLSMLRADLKEESFFTSTQTFKGLLTSYIYLKSFLLNAIFFGCHSGGNLLNMKQQSLSMFRADLKEESFFTSTQTFKGLQTSYIYLKSFLLNDIFFGCHSGGNYLNMKHPSLSKYRVDLKGEGFFNSIQTFRGLQTSIIYLKSFLLNDNSFIIKQTP